MATCNDYSKAVTRMAAALEMLDQAQAMNVDFAIIEAELMVEEAEMALDEICHYA